MKSNCFGGDAEDTQNDAGNQRGAHRQENAWQSSVFAGPEAVKANRRKLGASDHGTEGLFGNNNDPDAWTKKQNFAGTLSQKQQSRPPQFNEQAANQRKLNDLYGNSYQAV